MNEPRWRSDAGMEPLPDTRPTYCVGLDLGQANDFSAIGILEMLRRPRYEDDPYPPIGYDLRHLGRWELKTPYPTIVRELDTLLNRLRALGHVSLVVDATGVGRAVIDLLRAARLNPIPVTITGALGQQRGSAVMAPDELGYWRVPKRDLVGSLAVAFETATLRVAASLQYAQTLRAEMQSFKARVTVHGNDTYEAWRESDHDDLVLAVALACWWAPRVEGARFTQQRVQQQRDDWTKAV